MNASSPLFRGVPVLVGLALAGCQGVPAGPGTADAFPTRDVKTADVRGGHAAFIVSLNNDDDDNNRRADLRDPLVAATDDNVRTIVFHHPTADAVYVADILDLTAPPAP